MNVDAQGFVSRLPEAQKQTLQLQIKAAGLWQDQARLKNLRFSVKDLFDIAGCETAAGNPDWLADHGIAQSTSPLVSALLAEGADLVGKTLTDELAYSLNGQNIHYASLVNPAAPKRITGGSSSGAVVSVASGAVDFALGTDTGGSIRVPASYCGVTGWRPSHGVLSLDHCVPLAPAFDTAGFLARDIRVLQAVAKVLLDKPSATDSQPELIKTRMQVDGTELWSAEIDQWLDSRQAATNAEALILSEAWVDEASQAFRILQGRQIWQQHGAWIEQRQPRFGEDIQQRFAWCKTLTPEDQLWAEQVREQLKNTLYDRLDTAHWLVFPTTPGAAPRMDSSAQYLADYRKKLMGLTALAGLLGAPQISLPVLHKEDAPWGVSILAMPGQDQALLAFAASLMNSVEAA